MKRGGGRTAALALALGLGVASTALFGCGDDKKPDTQPTEAGAASTSAPAQTSGAPKAEAPAGKIPDQVADLFAAVPENATLVARAPALSDLGVPKETLDTALPLLLKELASSSQVPEALLKSVLEGYDGIAAFTIGDDLDAKPPPLAVVARFKDEKVAESLISELKLEKVRDGRYKHPGTQNTPVHVEWLAKPRVAVISPSEPALDAALDALAGKAPSFASGPNASGAGAYFVYGDLHRLIKNPELFAIGSMASMSFGSVNDASMTYRMFGDKVPRLSTVLAPAPHDALAKLPGKPAMALDLSLARPAGKKLADLFAEIGRASGADFTPQAESALKSIGLSLSDFDRALGPSATLAMYMPEGPIDPTKLDTTSTVFFYLPFSDDAVPKKLFDTAKAAAGKEKGIQFGANRVTADISPVQSVLVELVPGGVVGAFGGKKLLDPLVATFKSGKGTLGETPGFATFKATMVPSQLAVFVDYDQMLAAVPKDLPFQFPLKGVTGSDLLLNPTEKGIDASLKGGGAVPMLGTMGALAIYGVRRYLQSAKTSEAKNTIGAIARGAVGAYERESLGAGGAPSHQLCKSAQRVPATIPSGKKYQPSSAPGTDFESGDATSGWKCLKFTIVNPIYYSYEYRAGGPYKCPARGGTDPGPDGFEISAEGDLDGDGVTSLFCQIGKVDPTTQVIKLGTQLFIADEFE
jgi:hypothetical protein